MAQTVKSNTHFLPEMCFLHIFKYANKNHRTDLNQIRKEGFLGQGTLQFFPQNTHTLPSYKYDQF